MGLSESIRAEVRGTSIDVSVVMPVVVHTELGSGLPETRGFRAVEPEDVASAIVEALQRGSYEVYVPRSVGALMRAKALLPARAMEAVARFLKGDEVLANPDRAQRAAYEARMAATISSHDAAAAEREREAA